MAQRPPTAWDECVVVVNRKKARNGPEIWAQSHFRRSGSEKWGPGSVFVDDELGVVEEVEADEPAADEVGVGAESAFDADIVGAA